MRFSVVAILLFLSAVGLGYTYNQSSSAPTFMTAPVERGVIIKYVRASGVIEPVVTVEVSSQLSGRVADVLVNFNDTVTQGQVIARLDPEAYDARVGEAKAALKVAEADALLQKKTIERAAASLHSAETALRAEQAQMNVEQARQEERERDYQRFMKLAKTSSIADQEVTHGRALRDAGAASLLVLEQQINLKAEAVDIARTDIAMAKAHLANADAVVEQRQAALNQAEVDREHTEIRAPIDGIVKSPGEVGGVETRSAYVVVGDADAVYARAQAASAPVVRPIQNTDYGSREFTVKDPEGHSWSVGTYDPWAQHG